jgi:hypothetical protein
MATGVVQTALAVLLIEMVNRPCARSASKRW